MCCLSCEFSVSSELTRVEAEAAVEAVGVLDDVALANLCGIAHDQHGDDAGATELVVDILLHALVEAKVLAPRAQAFDDFIEVALGVGHGLGLGVVLVVPGHGLTPHIPFATADQEGHRHAGAEQRLFFRQ